MFPFKIALLFVLLPLAFSCSHVQSGRYIRLKKGEGLESLATLYGTTPAHLLSVNKGRYPARGRWYFIPQGRGILGQTKFRSSTGITESYLSSGKFIWPVPSSRKISSHYGKRWGKQHQGIDIAGRTGSAIVATANGRVIYSGNGLGGYGNLIVISHGGGVFSVYAHNKKNFVKVGQKAYKGQVIAELGMSGRTTGPHLHFEIRKNSRSLDPVQYVYKRW